MRIYKFQAALLAAGLLFAGACVAGPGALAADSHHSTLQSQRAETVTGLIAGLNLKSRTFWINAGHRNVMVMIGNAKIWMNNKHANLYRLLGTPRVRAYGVIGPDGMMNAQSIRVLGGPRVPLERSIYTDKAQPPFTKADLRGHSGR